MLAQELYTTDYIPLSADQTVEEALNRMEELHAQCLPVTDSDGQMLIGQLQIEQLHRAETADMPISSFSLEEPVKLFLRQHVFEAARLLYQYELDVVPIVDEEGRYKGMISRQTLQEQLPKLMNLDTDGSILTIELDKIDFTLSEIVHLIEVEGAKILGLAVERPQQTGENFRVSIKINLKDATRVTSSLKRHDYHVAVDDASRDVFGFDMENRADELLKYIDM